MDLTFQISMQDCSLQHWTLLLSPAHQQLGVVFVLGPSLHSLWSYFFTLSNFQSNFTKVCLVKAMVFPVVMRGCESWTVKKAKGKGKGKSLSCVRLFATPWTVAHRAPPSMGFSRQEDWSGLPVPSPGELPNPGTEPGSPAL